MPDGARVAQATWVSLFIILGIGVAAWLFIRWEGEPSRWQRFTHWLSDVMSRRAAAKAASDPANKVVCRPVEATSMAPQTTPPAASGMAQRAPNDRDDLSDMDAANGGMDWRPRLTLYPEQRELIAYLAVIRHRNGKYQLSANQIVAATRGDRNMVLKLVREIRDGVPQYPPATPEQEATRAALGLNN